MKYFIILLLFLLPNCSGYSVASLTSNIITYSATGKTNTGHVASYITGKDCRVVRVLTEEAFCEEKNLIFAENESKHVDDASFNIVENDSNLIIYEIEENHFVEEKIKLAYVDKIINNIYYGSLTWAEYQLTRGTKASDKIGITKNLTEDVKKAFNYRN